jgi:hypothetical protein
MPTKFLLVKFHVHEILTKNFMSTKFVSKNSFSQNFDSKNSLPIKFWLKKLTVHKILTQKTLCLQNFLPEKIYTKKSHSDFWCSFLQALLWRLRSSLFHTTRWQDCKLDKFSWRASISGNFVAIFYWFLRACVGKCHEQNGACDFEFCAFLCVFEKSWRT